MFERILANKLPFFVLALTFFTLFLTSCAETLPIANQDDLVFDETKYKNANILRGGRLYDKWWAEKRVSAPTGANPVWEYTANPDSANGLNGGQWRCKTCHGWDYKGINGAYGDLNSSNYTGVRGLINDNPGFTPESAFKVISNGVVQRIQYNNPDPSVPEVPHVFYGNDKLDASDIYDLTKFIFEFANRDSIEFVTGDPVRGKEVYIKAGSTGNSCSSIGCHSANKALIVDVAQTNEAEFLHKVRVGNPGTFMPGGLDNRQAKDVYEFVKSGANLTVIPTSDFDQATYDALGNDDIALGGLLYDKWWDAAASATEPGTTHSLWPPTNTTTGSDTWRCKECHGWDYRGKDGAYGNPGKHNTGIKGIVNTANSTMLMLTADNVYSFLKTDANHGFNNKFSAAEFYALTKFIMTMREEAAQNKASFNFINDNSLTTINGNKANGKTLYEDTTKLRCATCHGSDGKLLDFADHTVNPDAHEFLNDIAQENPWEFIHKLRFGQPASSMPGSIQITSPASFASIEAAVDILAYAQTELVPNIKRAGLLYDKWWKVKNVKVDTPPSQRNASWTGTTDTTKVDNPTTWRCKECHGWDYNGVDGAYGDATSKHYSGIKGFLGSTQTKSKTETEIFDLIKTGPASVSDHAFGLYLSDEDITLLAQFIKDDTNGVPPVADLNTALASSNTTNGKTLYEASSPGNCKTCHGANGKTLPQAVINVLANDNGPEFIHKSRFGNPGSAMTPTSTLFQGLSLAQAGDVLAYSKTLGQTTGVTPSYSNADPVRGGRLFDKWWAEMQASDDTVQPPAQENPHWLESYNPSIIPGSKRTTDSWRCKSCHAWNYKGIGFFNSGIPTDNGNDNLLNKINNVLPSIYTNTTDLQNYIFNWIKNGDPSGRHRFGSTVTATLLPSPLGDQEIWDLTRFLLDGGIIDSFAYIQASGYVRQLPDEANRLSRGEGLFKGSISSSVNCSDSTCHGLDGKARPGVDVFALSAPYSATTNTEGNPWEFLHKVRFGQPGTAMPSLIDSGLNLDDAYDVLIYGQQTFNSSSPTQ